VLKPYIGAAAAGTYAGGDVLSGTVHFDLRVRARPESTPSLELMDENYAEEVIQPDEIPAGGLDG
jgi:hypothetical protein